MFVVVSYDIPEDRRRTKVMKLLRNFGAHVQYSVFECELKEAAYQQLHEQLTKLIAPQVDNVRFYFLDEDQVKRIEVIGRKPVERPREFYVVG
jgi:CRISPR-associated protein Cas2